MEEVKDNWGSPIRLEWLWRLHKISVEFHRRVNQTCKICRQRDALDSLSTIGVISRIRIQVTQLIVVGRQDGRSPIAIEWLVKLETQLRQSIRKAFAVLIGRL